jgi:hypothetical protein
MPPNHNPPPTRQTKAKLTLMNIHNLSLASIGPLGTPEIIIILFLGAIMALVAVLPFWFICRKAGLSPWLSFLMIIPFGALVLPFILAFIDWPSLKRDTAQS